MSKGEVKALELPEESGAVATSQREARAPDWEGWSPHV